MTPRKLATNITAMAVLVKSGLMRASMPAANSMLSPAKRSLPGIRFSINTTIAIPGSPSENIRSF